MAHQKMAVERIIPNTLSTQYEGPDPFLDWFNMHSCDGAYAGLTIVTCAGASLIEISG